MTVRDDLLAAYALIQDEARWCRWHYAGDNGTHCATGAIMAATKGRMRERFLADQAVDRSSKELFGLSTTEDVNDRYGHRAVTMVLRHAILREEGLA